MQCNIFAGVWGRGNEFHDGRFKFLGREFSPVIICLAFIHVFCYLIRLALALQSGHVTSSCCLCTRGYFDQSVFRHEILR
jgi:hypothetical protein